MEMTFIDFFSGIGGFRKGFELCGMRCAGHCEIDKYADRSYRAIFDVKEDEWYANDITKISPGDLPRASLWAGGFPCQDISCAGSQRGLDGARSGLFFEITRLLEGTAPEDRPKWIVLENVKNLLSVNRGFDLATVLYTLAALGYCVEYGLLNSKFFGVPQNRERIYIVAYRHLGAGRGQKIFPVIAGSGKALIQLIGGMQGQRVYDPSGVSVTIASESGGWGGKTGLYFIDLNRGTKLTDTARCIKARYNCGVTNRSGDNSGILYGCARAVLTPERAQKRQNGRRIKDCGEPSFTVTQTDRHGVMLCQCQNCPMKLKIREATKQGYSEAACGDSINLSFPDSKTRRGCVGKGIVQTLETSCNQGVPFVGCCRIRRLTPRETFVLQGFSNEMFDKARVVNSDNQLYRQSGNSVTISVVYAVGQRIVEVQKKYEEMRLTE
jgi:DNA (cytosine-5)-methyltransferase 1